LSSDSSQTAAPLPRLKFLIEWPNEAKTLISELLWDGSAKETCWQAKSAGLTVVTLTFPPLKLTAANIEKGK